MSTPSISRVRLCAGLVLLVVLLAGVVLHTHQDSRCVTCQATQRLAAGPSAETAACPLVALGWTPAPGDSVARSAIAFQQILSRAPPA